MLLSESKSLRPFGDPNYIYEIKYDGYRMGALVSNSTAKLATKSGVDCTSWFPEVAKALATLRGGPHVMDGEAVVLDDIGRSDYNRLHSRALRRGWKEGADRVAYCVFDLLALDGRSLINLPIESRKAMLRELLTPPPPGVLYVDHFTSQEGAGMFEAAKQLQLEGLVAKRLGSPYRPGIRSEDWLKLKVPGAIPPQRFRRGPSAPER